MRLIRFLLCCAVLMFMFVLGVSAADKEYLSDRLIGIQMFGDEEDLDPYMQKNIVSVIDKSRPESAEELYSVLVHADYMDNLVCEPRYFDAVLQGNQIIPAGMYDTVSIYFGGGDKLLSSFVYFVEPLNKRFEKTNEPIYVQLQSSYIKFLSLIGRSEKMFYAFLNDVL